MSTNQARGLGARANAGSTAAGKTIDGCFERRKIGASRIQGAAAPPTSKKITTARPPNEAHRATSATFDSFRYEAASVAIVTE